tara:strand:+ start:139 stop:606 length:468 start_codon:yes stop_codon:yes gene_type:complete
MIAYLSGPIENAHNDGAGWRNNITKWLGDKLSHRVFDPVLETKSIIQEIDSNDFRMMKITDPIEYKKIIRKIIKLDLNALVDKADYLIVNWDQAVFRGGGTHGEVTMAYWLNKPVYMVNSLPMEDVSSWIFSCTDFVCDNFEELKEKLEQTYLLH